MSPELTDQFWSDRDSFMGMIGGMEDDAERAEEVLGSYQFRPRFPGSLEKRERDYSKIQNAVRKIVHRFRTAFRSTNDRD
jgi:hypothetical protein